MTRVLMPHPTTKHPETVSFGLLPCLVDRHVHAVRDPAEKYPRSACDLPLLPDLYLEGAVVLCRRCLAALPDPDNTELRPAARERRRANSTHAGRLTEFERWRRARKYDRRIRRALAEEWHRG